MNVLIIGGTIFARNRGVAAITKGCIDCLRKNFKNPKITLIHTFVESYYPQKTTNVEGIKIVLDGEQKFVKLAKNIIIRLSIVMLWRLLNFFHININSLYDKTLKEYLKANVVINLSYGDMFAYKKDFYSKLLFFTLAYQCIIAILLKKPLVFFPQSIGPFNNRFSQFLAKFILNHCNVIMVREGISRDYLLKMKVASCIFLVPDLSFIVEPASKNRVLEILSKEKVSINSPLIGIALRDNLYTRLSEISKIINYLNSKLNANVILIPHFSSIDTNHYYYDPRYIAKKLLKMVNAKSKIARIEGEYTAEELRGIIGACDLFIGAYMHANISAISMCKPAIAISYSHKTHGLMELVGLEEFVLDINKLEAEVFINKIDKMYDNLSEYKQMLRQKVPKISKTILKAGKLVQKFCFNNA